MGPRGTVTVRHRSNTKERPRSGWKLYEKTNSGGEVLVRSKRGRAVKKSDLAQALRWVNQHRPGYDIQIEAEGYFGKLTNS